MSDSRRTLLRWIGTIAGPALMAFGVHLALIRGSLGCSPSGGLLYVCRGHPADHPHAVLGVLVGTVGLAILVGSRRPSLLLRAVAQL